MLQLIRKIIALPGLLRRGAQPEAPRAVEAPAAPVEVEEQAPEPAPEPAPPSHASAAQLARRLGLSIEDDGAGAWRWRRHEATWPGAPAPDAPIEEADARRAVWAEALGIRLGLDTLAVAWSPEVERPAAPERVFRKEDVPSPYGERLPWLVPIEALELWRQITARAPVERPWIDEVSCVAFVLEVGSRLHVLSEQEAGASLGAARLVEDARLAWFYASYKAWAKTEQLDVGKLRVYATSEGLGAGRALLLPELDWDAARARGLAATPTRDELWVLEPATGVTRGAARAALEARVIACYEAADWPMSRALLAIDEQSARLIAPLDEA